MFQQRPKEEAQPFNPHINQQTVAQHQEQKQVWEDEGGRIQDGYVEDQEKKTELKTTQCPVAEQPVSYTEEAKKMDLLNEEFDQTAKLVDKKLAEQDTDAHEQCSVIKKLEMEAQLAQQKLSKEQEEHKKEQSKLHSEFEQQQLKTAQMAEELSRKQAEQNRLEAARAKEMLDKDAEARRLAEDLAAQRAEDRRYVEQQIAELDDAEAALKEKIRRLMEHQNKEVAEMELKQQEMKTSVEIARKDMEELKRRHDKERQDLNAMQTRFNMIRAQAFAAHKEADKHLKEREALLERVRELDIKMGEASKKAMDLDSEKKQLEQDIINLQLDISRNKSAIDETATLVEKKQAARETLECHAKEQLQNEQLALEKAEELKRKVDEERNDLESDLSRLAKEEEQAQRLLAGGRLNEDVEERFSKDNFREEVKKTEITETTCKEGTESCASTNKQWTPPAEPLTLTEKILDTVVNKLL